MSLATAVILFRRNGRDYSRGVDLVGVDVVGVDRNRFAVMLDMIGSQIYGYFETSPRCRGFGSGAGKRIKCFDCINDVPCVGAWVSHDFAENWRSVDDLDLRSLPLGGAGAYPP